MAKLTFERFIAFLNEYKLLQEDAGYVLAVSGGIDSMVMTDLFVKAGVRIMVAHINHNLRGKDALEDASFVRKYCEIHNVRYVQYDVDPVEYRRKNIQEKAREIRYRFLNETLKKNSFQYICTAHHTDDMIESFFMHLLRGSGLTGLSSIPIRQGLVIRPLSGFSKKEIIDYARENGVPFREDYTNEQDKYLRNKVRHHIIPAFEELQSGAIQKIADSINLIKDSQELIEHTSEFYLKKWKGEGNTILQIPIEEIFEIKGYKTLLHNTLHPYGFNSSQIDDILFSTSTGTYKIHNNFILGKNRNYISLLKYSATQNISETVDTFPYQFISNGCKFDFEVNEKCDLNLTENHLSLDLNKIVLPLKIRPWTAGDRFQPLGMKGKTKKVKDFLTDLKVDSLYKKNVFVVISGEIIAAVLPYRIAENFRIRQETKTVLKISTTAVSDRAV